MDVFRISCEVRRIDRITNERIKELMGVKETIIENIQRKQFTWYEHVRKMAEGRLPRTTMEWIATERQKKGRPRKSWEEGIRKDISERNLQRDQCLARNKNEFSRQTSK